MAAIAYLAWFVVGLVSLFQTDVIMIIVGSLLWLAGSFMVCDIMVRIVGVSYVPFAQTIPFRLLFGLPVFNCHYSMVPLDSHKRRSTKSGNGKELAVHQVNVAEQQKGVSHEMGRSYSERRLPDSFGEGRRIDLHTSMWRLCDADNPPQANT